MPPYILANFPIFPGRQICITEQFYDLVISNAEINDE